MRELEHLDKLVGIVLGLTVVAAYVWQLSMTPEGQAAIAKIRQRLENCEGCAGRKEALRKAWNRTAFDVETLPVEEHLPEGYAG